MATKDSVSESATAETTAINAEAEYVLRDRFRDGFQGRLPLRFDAQQPPVSDSRRRRNPTSTTTRPNGSGPAKAGPTTLPARLIAHKTQPSLAEMSETVYSKQVTVTSPNGLHLRPLEMLVSLARQYNSRIEIIKDTERIDGKSMMEGLGLISGQGTQLTIEACGADAQEALAALARLFEAKFEESPADSSEPPAS